MSSNYPQLYMKLTYTNGKTYIPSKPEKRKIVAKLSTASIKSVYLRATYLPGVYNDGTYDNKKDALQFIRAAFEKEQLEFVYGGEW